MSMPRAKGVRLVADIGGTNARFALVKPGSRRLSEYRELPTNDYPSLAPAMEAYLEQSNLPTPTEAAVAIANPVTGDQIKMTNTRWSFSTRAVKKRLGLKRLIILNDFAALALSIPLLGKSHVRKIGGGRPTRGNPLALIGPGTGLGMAGLVEIGKVWTPLASEGGHVTAAANNDEEVAVLGILRKKYDHVSAERVVSGPGLVNLYRSICQIRSIDVQPLTAAEISAEGKKRGGRTECRAALEMFCALLGSLAGDLALTLGARAGVYIGGGIVPALGDFFDNSAFRARFVEKGRMQPLLESIPTYVVQAPHAAMLGDLQALAQ
jgi:glucokinase